MVHEGIQNQSATTSNNGNINYNRQNVRRPSMGGLVVPVEGIPRRPSSASSSTLTRIKIQRRLSQAGVPNQSQQQNQQLSPASCSVSTPNAKLTNQYKLM